MPEPEDRSKAASDAEVGLDALGEGADPFRSAADDAPNPEPDPREGADKGTPATPAPSSGRKWSDLKPEERTALESYRKEMEAGVNRSVAKRQKELRGDYENKLRELDALKSALDARIRDAAAPRHPLSGHMDESQFPAMDQWGRGVARDAVSRRSLSCGRPIKPF